MITYVFDLYNSLLVQLDRIWKIHYSPTKKF